eukprot:265810-Ditylum_brightwellii.AAC.1
MRAKRERGINNNLTTHLSCALSKGEIKQKENKARQSSQKKQDAKGDSKPREMHASEGGNKTTKVELKVEPQIEPYKSNME